MLEKTDADIFSEMPTETVETIQLVPDAPAIQPSGSLSETPGGENRLGNQEIRKEQGEPIIEAVPAESVTADQLLESEQNVRRGRGRHPKDCQCPKCRVKRESASQIQESEAAALNGPDYKLMSELVFDTSTNSFAMLLGDEWRPVSENERQGVCGPLATYLKAKQTPDIPPGMLLLLVCMAYSAPRLRAPSTSGKLRNGWNWLKSKLSWRKKSQVSQPTLSIEK